MFCNRCGAALGVGVQFCTTCGARVLPGPQMAQPFVPGSSVAPSSGVRRNVEILAVLWGINGALRLLEVLAFTLLGHWFLPGVFGRTWGGWGMPFFWHAWPFSLGLVWVAVALGIFGVIHLILAWGLYEHKVWARPLALVIGFLALIRFPLGTALGAYTLWVMLPESSAREYERIAVP